MADVETKERVFSVAAVRAQALAILRAWGMEDADAEVTADVMIDADLRGIESHGTSLLAFYARFKPGQLNFKARPKLEKDGPSFALIDADAALGFAVSAFAMGRAVEKAKATGVALVLVRNSHHFGPAGYYARMAADAGLVGMVMCTTKIVTLVPTFGAEPVLGTNPIAFGIPTGEPGTGNEPIVFDMATSTVAGNKVRVYHLKDKPLPQGWVVDGQGQPITDPHTGYEYVFERKEGGLTPVGGTPDLSSYKGYGLALMVQFLSGSMAGAAFPPMKAKTDAARAPGTIVPDNIGHFFMAMAPAVFRAFGDFTAEVREIADTLRAARPADPRQPVILPGDKERAMRLHRLAHGIPLPTMLLTQLKDIAHAAGAPFHLT